MGDGLANPCYGNADKAQLESVGTFVDPRSLYLARIKDRSGDTAVAKTASADEYISRQAAWETIPDQYQDIPHWGDPNNLYWLAKKDYSCASGITPVIVGILNSSWMLPTSYPFHKQILGNPSPDTNLSGKMRIQ